jgi:PHD-finger
MASASASTHMKDTILESNSTVFFTLYDSKTDGVEQSDNKNTNRDCVPLADTSCSEQDVSPICDDGSLSLQVPMEQVIQISNDENTSGSIAIPIHAECHASTEQDSNDLPNTYGDDAVVSKQSQLPAAVRKLLITSSLDSKDKLAAKRKSKLSVNDYATYPGSEEGINIIALHEYDGPRCNGKKIIDNCEYISKPIHFGWTRVPEIKCRSLVPNVSNSAICEIEIETGSWQIGENNILKLIPTRKRNRISIDDGDSSTLLDENIYLTVVDNNIEMFCNSNHPICIETEIEKSRRIEGHKRQQSTSHNAHIRIGDKYQARILDHPSTYDRSKDETNYTRGTVLWDPIKADAAIERNEPVAEYLERKDLELNVKYLLMESLHETEYNTKPAMKLFIEKYRTEHKRLIELNASETTLFNKVIAPRMLAIKKDFVGASKLLNRTVECILVHYYLWKRRHRDYQRIKREQRKEPDYCTVCNDGGILIVCELCRKAFHMECCKPKLTRVPVGDWYCNHCTCSSPAQVRRLSSSANTPNGFSNMITNGNDKNKRPSAQRNLNMKVKNGHNMTPSQRRRTLRNVHKELTFTSTNTKKIEKIDGDNTISNQREMVWNPSATGWKSADSHSNISTLIPSHGYNHLASSSSPMPRLSTPSKSPNHSSITGSVRRSSLDGEQFQHSILNTPENDESSKASAITKQSDSTFYNEDDEEYEDFDDDSPEKKTKTFKKQRMSDTKTNDPQQVVFYDIQVPITSEGLLVHISEIPAKNGGGVAFNGYRRFSSGKIGPAQKMGLFQSVGDKFHCVDGTFCSGKSFSQIKILLKDNIAGQKVKYLRMRHIVTKQVQQMQVKSIETLPQSKNGMGMMSMKSVNNSFKDPAIFSLPSNGSNFPDKNLCVANPSMEIGQGTISNISTQAQQHQLQRIMSFHQPLAAPKLNAGNPTDIHHPFHKDFCHLQNALAPLQVPDLMHFLNRRGIFDANAFLRAASATLAAQWSAERMVPYDLAMDFMGAVRLQVRQYFGSNVGR